MNRNKLIVKESISTDQDHVWVSASAKLDADATTVTQAKINITKSDPILSNPSYYNLAVSRFSISSRTIPIFEFKNNYWYVSLKHVASGDIFTFPVIHLPTAYNNSPFIFEIQDFINDVNTALILCHAALLIAHPAFGSVPPVFIYDSIQDTVSILVPYDYIDTTTIGVDIVEIWLNNKLSSIFGKLWVFFGGYNNVNKLDSKIRVQDKGWNQYSYTFTITVYSTNTKWFKMDQTSTGTNLLEFTRILITSNSIPVTQENVIVDNSLNLDTSTPTVGLNILTDFTILSNTGTPINNITYDYVSDIYRQIPLVKTDPFYNIELKCFLQNKDGNIVPLLIGPGQEFFIKILFLKKGLTT